MTKFKVGDKVRPTHEYMVEHARSYKVIWGVDYPEDGWYDNMTVVYVENGLVITNISKIPWFESDLELIS